MNYAPRNMYVWDVWYMLKDDVVHAYHLQRIRPGAQIPQALEDELGHAVSRNLVDWEELPTAFGPDPSNPLDDRQPWTGCALWHEDQGYLYYTMRGSLEEKKVQRIGLATTRHPDQWKRYPGNPIIVPSPQWYATVGNPIPGALDCRDLQIIRSPENDRWLGFYATRRPGKELPETAVIARVSSQDLIHWEHHPPAYAPEKYATIEVPDVFEMNGNWYLTCLTGNSYGNRGIWSDPRVNHGTLYAVSDRPEGPYEELKDNTLIVACTAAPVSCRSFLFEGERYVLYTDRERKERNDKSNLVYGSLTTPKVLKTDGDRLVAVYSPRIESLVNEDVIGRHQAPPRPVEGEVWGHGWHWKMPTAHWEWESEDIIGNSRTGWGVLPFDRGLDSFIYESEIILESGVAAGFALRMENNREGAILALDAQEQEVFYAETPEFFLIERRQASIPLNQPIHLRVVNRLEHVEIYINDVLHLAFCRYRGLGGRLGLFVDRGRARFRNIRLRKLNIHHPE